MNNEGKEIDSEVMQKIVGMEEASVGEEDEMISKAAVDMYIQESINKMWADKVRMEKEEKAAKLKREEAVIEEYTGVMKDSDEPWVDLKGYKETEHGVKISLDWNDAFVEHLRAEGLTGVDEDQIVHKWLAMLMQQVSQSTEPNKSEFEE